MTARLLEELRTARVTADISQREVAAALGWSQSEYFRFENRRTRATSIVDVSAVASVLGLELGAGLHPIGDAIRDRGHQALIGRLRAELSPAFRVTGDVPLPLLGDPRAWDLLVRLGDQLIGVEAETQIRDIQHLVRHVHQRERDGGVDEIIVLLAASRKNRGLVSEFRLALGDRYAKSPRVLLRALRNGERLPGSGVILL